MHEAVRAVNLAKSFYEQQRTDLAFESFYKDVLQTAQKLEIGEPQLQEVAKRFNSG